MNGPHGMHGPACASGAQFFFRSPYGLHVVHSAEPTSILCFPAAHAVHVPPSTPVYPALQRQLVERLLPSRDCELLGQLRQEPTPAAPRVSEYLPAPQSMHIEATDAPVAAEYLPVPQSKQVAIAEAPVAVEYLPAPQSVHMLNEEAPEYLPAPQSTQVLTT